jgi:MFS transporter, UMF1 family
VAAVIWSLICGSTWFVDDKVGFYIIAFFVGTVMGGIQALSRSTYAKLLPETEDHASYFSFYELTEKVATAVGTLSFGLIIAASGSMRNSTVFLGMMFLIGVMFLAIANRKKNPVRSA